MRLTRRLALVILACAALPGRGRAVPRRYRLDPDGTRVGFGFLLKGIPHAATIPVTRASLQIDPDDLARARIAVTLDATAARAGLFYATEAMRGPGVLDAAHHPEIRFVSTAIRLGPGGRLSGGARVRGLLTLRGVTRPVEMDAALYRPQGSAPDDLDDLTVHLRGAVSRAAFGATGHADLVADTVTLDITARIRAGT